MKKCGLKTFLARLVLGTVFASLDSVAVTLHGTRQSVTPLINSTTAAVTPAHANRSSVVANSSSAAASQPAGTTPTQPQVLSPAGSSSTPALDSGVVAPRIDVFRKDCLAHLKQIIAEIDHSYTDVQILPRLEQECELGHEFPAVWDHGFERKQACHNFAVQLTDARAMELQSGSEKGYELFCLGYYEHKYLGAKKQNVTVKIPEKVEIVKASGLRWKLVVALTIAVVLLAIGCFANKR